MKINDIIILNCATLSRFFDFEEFWAKRQEFVKSIKAIDPKVFFNPARPKQRKLYEVVKQWVEKTLDTDKIKIDGNNASYGTLSCTLTQCGDCDKFLESLKPTDALGLICLYEMLNRTMKDDLTKIANALNASFVDWSGDVVTVPQGAVVTLPQGPVEAENGLRTVLIVNYAKTGKSGMVSYGDISVTLRPRECCHALFCGNVCVGLLPNAVEHYRLRLSAQDIPQLMQNDTPILHARGIAAFYVNPSHPNRYVLVDDRGRIVSYDKDIDDFTIRTSIPRHEKILHLLIDPQGELYILTAKKQLYVYNRNGLRLLNQGGPVLMINLDKFGNIDIKHPQDYN